MDKESKKILEALETLSGVSHLAYRKAGADKIASIWSIEDVQGRAEDNGGKIPTDDEAKEILYQIDKNHDANEGINWDVIDYYL
jgi:hypothetical protein